MLLEQSELGFEPKSEAPALPTLLFGLVGLCLETLSFLRPPPRTQGEKEILWAGEVGGGVQETVMQVIAMKAAKASGSRHFFPSPPKLVLPESEKK